MKEYGNDENCYEGEDEVLDEPRCPVHPHTQSHHFH